jgi:hypothetical protein
MAVAEALIPVAVISVIRTSRAHSRCHRSSRITQDAGVYAWLRAVGAPWEKILDKRSPEILVASLVYFGIRTPKYRSAENLVDLL